MQLSKLPKKLFPILALSLSSCGTFEVADITPRVRLPASQDCYGITVLTHRESRMPKDQCERLMNRAIFITSEDWKKQKISIEKNCQMAQCRQFTGAFDSLFLAIDQGLQKVPGGN